MNHFLIKNNSFDLSSLENTLNHEADNSYFS